jgi:hypothetical protein
VSLIIAAMTVQAPAVIAAAGCIMMTIPVSGSFSIEKPRPRKAMFVYTGVMGVLLIASIAMSLFGSKIYGAPLAVFVVGFFLFSWIANGINMRS